MHWRQSNKIYTNVNRAFQYSYPGRHIDNGFTKSHSITIAGTHLKIETTDVNRNICYPFSKASARMSTSACVRVCMRKRKLVR